MCRKYALFTLFALLASTVVFASQKDSTRTKNNYYSLSVGIGWVHYVNNLDVGHDAAKNNFIGTSFKFFWEPKFRLSLGLESGYYKLYKVSKELPAGTAEAEMSVVPLLLIVRMRIIDNLYLSAGGGMSLMMNKVNVINDQISSTILSLSNYQASASYLYPLSRLWHVGGEFKVLYYGKADDLSYTLQGLVAIKF